VHRTSSLITRCVDDEDTAHTVEWCNPYTLNIEIAHRFPDREEITEQQYMDCAWKVAQWCKKFSIPVVHDTANTLGIPNTGIRGHNELPESSNTSGHTDPGPLFKWDYFIKLVKEWMSSFK
jgi:N-acetyl-anhydromuramyl-L-alanine amidase AmpD